MSMVASGVIHEAMRVRSLIELSLYYAYGTRGFEEVLHLWSLVQHRLVDFAGLVKRVAAIDVVDLGGDLVLEYEKDRIMREGLWLDLYRGR